MGRRLLLVELVGCLLLVAVAFLFYREWWERGEAELLGRRLDELENADRRATARETTKKRGERNGTQTNS